MQLSTKGRYAVTAMIDLAVRDPNTLVSLSEIAEMQGISLSYLEQLFAKLRKKNIVTGVRGPGGGYRLARPASDISIADVVTAVDESIHIMKCDGKKNCHKGSVCNTHRIWEGLSQEIYRFLNEKSLQDAIDDNMPRHKIEHEHVIGQPLQKAQTLS